VAHGDKSDSCVKVETYGMPPQVREIDKHPMEI
jgi:hypothetical protein